MLRHRQHSRKDARPDLHPRFARTHGPGADLRIEVMCTLVDELDLHSFLLEPAYRRRVAEVFDCLSDEEFDRFERVYTSRFTVN